MDVDFGFFPILTILLCFGIICTMKTFEKNDHCVILGFDRKDRPFEWFLNVYQNGELDGKLVTMDEKMLLRILNSGKCFVLDYNAVDCDGGMDQTIKICWQGNNDTMAEAQICVHGPNRLVVDLSDGFVNYNIINDGRNWIYISTLKFISEYEGSYESRMLEEFEYAKNRTTDSQIVHMVYGYERSLMYKQREDEILNILKLEGRI